MSKNHVLLSKLIQKKSGLIEQKNTLYFDIFFYRRTNLNIIFKQHFYFNCCVLSVV